jgi:hypothetical protein
MGTQVSHCIGVSGVFLSLYRNATFLTVKYPPRHPLPRSFRRKPYDYELFAIILGIRLRGRYTENIVLTPMSQTASFLVPKTIDHAETLGHEARPVQGAKQ